MVIVTPIKNGEISLHFASADEFRLFYIKEHKIIDTSVIDIKNLSNGERCRLLKKLNTHTLISAKINEIAKLLLKEFNIALVTGAHGDPLTAVNNLIKNRDTLLNEYLENTKCDDDGHCHESEDYSK